MLPDCFERWIVSHNIFVFNKSSSVAAGFPRPKMWRGACTFIGVRIAATRSTTIGFGEALGAISARGTSSFLALLNISDIPRTATDDATTSPALPAKSNPEADGNTANTQEAAPSVANSAPEQIARPPRSQPESPASQAQPISSDVPTQPGSGNAPISTDRDPSVQARPFVTHAPNATAAGKPDVRGDLNQGAASKPALREAEGRRIGAKIDRGLIRAGSFPPPCSLAPSLPCSLAPSATRYT